MQSIFEMTDSVEWQRIYRIGEVKGKAEGFVEGERQLLIRQWTAGFGVPSGGVLNRLNSIGESDQLGQMAVRLLTAENWDELFSG